MQLLLKSWLRSRFPSGLWMRAGGVWLLRIAILTITLQTVSCSDNGVGPMGIVDGTVSLRDGAPLDTVVVSFFDARIPTAGAARATGAPKSPPIQSWTRTDANGRFSLRLPTGLYSAWVGGAFDAGVMSQQVGSVTVNSPRVSLDLHYNGYRVTGALKHLNVTLAAGSVFVVGPTNTARSELRESAYSLLLPAGTYDIWANPNEGYWGVPRVKFTGVAVAADTMIDFPCDGHFVQGTVKDVFGNAVSGATVGAQAEGAGTWNYTDSNGGYGLHLPDGVYDFLVTPPYVVTDLKPLSVQNVPISAPTTLDFVLQLAPVPVPVPPPKQ